MLLRRPSRSLLFYFGLLLNALLIRGATTGQADPVRIPAIAPAAATAGASTLIAPEDGRWTALLWPSARYGHATVYDPVRERLILFGGHDGVRRNDLWVLKLSGTEAWTPLAAAGPAPSARYTHSAVYDPGQDRVIVFGGDDGTIRNDVWALSLSGTPTWTALQPAGDPPPPRYRHSAIYDAAHQRMIVFGGKDTTLLYDDAWVLSLSGAPEWTRLEPSGPGPSGRYRHTAIYDAARGRMIVFGGDDGARRNDTWALDLAAHPSWSRLSTSGRPPSARKSHSALYDPALERMIVFGGTDSLQNDVWALDLSSSTWSSLAPSGSPPLGHWSHGAVFDPASRRMVVFGGETGAALSRGVSILSLQDGSSWSSVPEPGLEPGVSTASAIYDPVRRRILQFGGYGDNGNINETWSLSLDPAPVWERLATIGAPPMPRFGHGAIYDPVRDRMIVFGGQGNPNQWMTQPLSDTWALSLSGTPAWTRIAGPAAATLHGYTLCTVYDPVRDRLIVLETDYRTNVTLWTLPLSAQPAWTLAWTQIGQGTLPREHMYASLIYDPVRDRLIMFGGYMSTGYGYDSNDVWEFSLTSGGIL